jgi:hypothetical protein
MVLALQMLNEDATLNNFMKIGSAQFIPGTPVKLVMRLMQTARDLRYVPDAAATFAMTLQNSDGTTLAKVPTFLDSGDRSLITVSLTGPETALLISQNLQVNVTEPSGVSAAQVQQGLQNANSLGC